MSLITLVAGIFSLPLVALILATGFRLEAPILNFVALGGLNALVAFQQYRQRKHQKEIAELQAELAEEEEHFSALAKMPKFPFHDRLHFLALRVTEEHGHLLEVQAKAGVSGQNSREVTSAVSQLEALMEDFHRFRRAADRLGKSFSESNIDWYAEHEPGAGGYTAEDLLAEGSSSADQFVFDSDSDKEPIEPT